MKFLIDADLPKSLKKVFESHGYQAVDVRDFSPYSMRGGAKSLEIRLRVQH